MDTDYNDICVGVCEVLGLCHQYRDTIDVSAPALNI